jgi:hypothetical protein
MSEREGPTWSGEGQPVAAELSERIRSMLADAEGAAAALRHQAEQEAQARMRAAETDALKVVEDARREAERFLADRIERVSRLSDEILERGQSVVERLDEADAVRAELAGLVTALGETAARLANEVRTMPGPRAPEIAAPPSERREWAEPDPPAIAAPEMQTEDPEPGRVLAPEGRGQRAEGGDPEPVAEPAPTAEPEPTAEAVAEPVGAPAGDQALGARLVALQMAVAGGNRGEVEAHLRRAFDLDQPGAILDDIFGSGTGADKRVAWPEAG